MPWARTLCPDSAAKTVTVDCPGRNPRATESGSQGLASSSSAKHSEYLPGQPWVDLSRARRLAVEAVQQHQAQRAADGGVRAEAGAEEVGRAVDAESPRGRGR